MTDEEYEELQTKVFDKYGLEITARFEFGVSTRNLLETYIELNGDDEDFAFSESAFIEYITESVSSDLVYLVEQTEFPTEGKLLTELGEEL